MENTALPSFRAPGSLRYSSENVMGGTVFLTFRQSKEQPIRDQLMVAFNLHLSI